MGRSLEHLWILAEEKIKHLLKQDQLINASDLLIEVTEVFDKASLNEAIVIARGVRKLQKDQIALLDYKTATEEGNNLTFRIMELLNNISPLPKGYHS